MKKCLLIAFILSMFLVGSVSAYGFYLNCTDTLPVGQTLKCSVDSDFPAGTGFDLIFYQSQYTATELDRKTMTIQSDQATQYALFDTTGLKGGQYKVEVNFNGAQPSLRSGSTSSALITLTDRSGELTITSPTTQNLADALLIAGSIAKEENNGVQIQVDGDSTGRIFGPQYIQTTSNIQSKEGVFSQTVSVTQPDDYNVQFADAEGTIGTVTFHVVAPTTATTAPVVTTVKTTKTTVPTTTTIPVPTTTKSPLPIFVILGALGIAVIGASRMSWNRK
ncbi:MAG: hypothetical protein LUQ31_01970 [Methanoregula sp.]|nr:hypothetical protein [Methanoregula sp.]